MSILDEVVGVGVGVVGAVAVEVVVEVIAQPQLPSTRLLLIVVVWDMAMSSAPKLIALLDGKERVNLMIF